MNLAVHTWVCDIFDLELVGIGLKNLFGANKPRDEQAHLRIRFAGFSAKIRS